MLKILANFVLALVVTIFFAGLAFAKPAPPKGLEGIFNEFSEVEEKFKEEKWNEAKGALNEVSEAFTKLVPELKKHVKGNIVNDFDFILNNFKKSLADKNMERSKKNYMALHKLFLDIMGTYEYKVPPVFKLIDKYIDEAKEALEKKDFERLISEMDEVNHLFHEGGRKILEEKGHLSKEKHFDFHREAKEVIEAAKRKDAEAAEKGLKRLEKESARFLSLFK